MTAPATRRSTLAFEAPKPPPGLKVLLYGASGTGKTTGALSAPGRTAPTTPARSRAAPSTR
jgi:hypothetical protein